MEESMNQDMKRAMLSDKEAAKRLTDAGMLLPCPFCKGNAKVSFKDHRFVGQNFRGTRNLCIGCKSSAINAEAEESRFLQNHS